MIHVGVFHHHHRLDLGRCHHLGRLNRSYFLLLLFISFLGKLHYFARIASSHENAQVERRCIWMHISKFLYVFRCVSVFGHFSKVVTHRKCNELVYQ